MRERCMGPGPGKLPDLAGRLGDMAVQWWQAADPRRRFRQRRWRNAVIGAVLPRRSTFDRLAVGS